MIWWLLQLTDMPNCVGRNFFKALLLLKLKAIMCQPKHYAGPSRLLPQLIPTILWGKYHHPAPPAPTYTQESWSPQAWSTVSPIISQHSGLSWKVSSTEKLSQITPLKAASPFPSTSQTPITLSCWVLFITLNIIWNSYLIFVLSVPSRMLVSESKRTCLAGSKL